MAATFVHVLGNAGTVASSAWMHEVKARRTSTNCIRSAVQAPTTGPVSAYP